MVEIDVITAMALGLTLDELILIYNVQFPVLQQNENDTWYDRKGNIVFTCSKGLTGVGVDRAVWNRIRHLQSGETHEHTITKSELYHGKKVPYHAPFDKCDRVEDYKRAWGGWRGFWLNRISFCRIILVVWIFYIFGGWCVGVRVGWGVNMLFLHLIICKNES